MTNQTADPAQIGKLAEYDPNPLTNLDAKTRDHWREFRPRMFRALSLSGKLDAAVAAAVALTKEAVVNALSRGMALTDAWELYQGEWCILPSEEERPALNVDPATYEAPPEPDEAQDD